jgi:hypothetical protein
MAKMEFATKCINLNVNFILAGFIFFFKLYLVGLIKNSVKFFFACDIMRQNFGTCRTLNKKKKYSN